MIEGLKLLHVDRFKGHCGFDWPRVETFSEQWVLLDCEGQRHTSPFERARSEGWSWCDYRCVRPLFILFSLVSLDDPRSGESPLNVRH